MNTCIYIAPVKQKSSEALAGEGNTQTNSSSLHEDLKSVRPVFKCNRICRTVDKVKCVTGEEANVTDFLEIATSVFHRTADLSHEPEHSSLESEEKETHSTLFM